MISLHLVAHIAIPVMPQVILTAELMKILQMKRTKLISLTKEEDAKFAKRFEEGYDLYDPK